MSFSAPSSLATSSGTAAAAPGPNAASTRIGSSGAHETGSAARICRAPATGASGSPPARATALKAPARRGSELSESISRTRRGTAGLPLVFVLTPGQAGDRPQLPTLLDRIRVPGTAGRPRTRPDAVAADKAYASKANRTYLRRRRITVRRRSETPAALPRDPARR
ncbi:hypothetical protein Pen02_80250 [Plantactinospora endophytica]|uniref:Transposase IS4-like domain-containing protein n=1 Tax=Plantactinospora endophytica TaxID=673535 RepID=A0ABQ4EEH0_9ACTN|nr:hypothetical protein Pen02_80250 [Plantactinospora endophytica]